jgi:gamma-glutamyltranspeptidase / glutathione hydrolase
MEEPVMKKSISLCLIFLVFFLLHGAPADNTFARLRQSGKDRMSPEAWPPGELEKYSQLQRSYSMPPPAAESSQGMVAVTTDAFAARVGLEALQQGASAADAALAAALAQVVLKGGATVSFAGMMTMVYYDAASKKVYSLNAGYNTVREESDPKSIPGGGKASGRSAPVPGFFAGVQAAHNRFGKLPFARLFDSAIYLAEKGFVVDPLLGYFLKTQNGVLTRLPETKRVFTKENGELYGTGDLFKQPQLAETLRKVAAQGVDYLYQGEWAKRFVAAVRSEGGKMTLADLKAYRPIWAEPLQTDYHGYQVYGLGHPSLGGVTLIEILNLLEVADLQRYGHYTTSPEALYQFIQICRSPYLSGQSELVKKHAPELDLSPESRVKKETARLIWKKMNEPVWREMFAPVKPKQADSNHSAGVVAVDARGNVATILHSNNTDCNSSCWGATGIFVDGISIPDSAAIQQALIASLKPGDRLPEYTFPLIVLKNDKPYLASSSIGAAAVIPVTMSNLVNVLDFSMDPKKSIGTPNFRGPLSLSLTNEELVDGDIAKNIVEAVIAKGQPIKLLSKKEAGNYPGYWVAIQIDQKTGKLAGAAPSGFNAYVAGY